jgi:hypothetical protein
VVGRMSSPRLMPFTTISSRSLLPVVGAVAPGEVFCCATAGYAAAKSGNVAMSEIRIQDDKVHLIPFILMQSILTGTLSRKQKICAKNEPHQLGSAPSNGAAVCRSARAIQLKMLRSADPIRCTPAAAMLPYAAANQPRKSMPRQASGSPPYRSSRTARIQRHPRRAEIRRKTADGPGEVALKPRPA